MQARSLLLFLSLFVLSCSEKDIADDSADPVDSGVDSTAPPVDSDQDGFFDDQDCDDSNPDIHPDATEICNDVDDDCDGLIDDDDSSLDLSTTTAWYRDADGDGYGQEADTVNACAAPVWYVEGTASGFDCDDTDPAFHPGADESDCSDPNDYNCDGSVAFADEDADGWAACAECDDTDANVNPDAIEICNGIDDDCNGDIDDEDEFLDISTTTTWYSDNDADGFGDAANTLDSCSQPSDYVTDDTDCDDAESTTFPGATEYCDTVDNDCDGDTDENSAADVLTWYADTDSDGYGDAANTVDSCSQPTGYVADNTDCDDSAYAINPAATEVCDTVDNNCDGDTDEDSAADVLTWYADNDSDGYGDASNTDIDCDQPTGYVADNTDCDDSNASLYPGSTGNIVTVKACIDGSDWLYVQGSSLWWVHRNYDKVGQHSDCGGFTYTVVDGNNWSHSWSGNTTNTYTAMATGLPSTGTVTVSVSKSQGRGNISVTQQPNTSNGYTAAVLFDDDGPGGAATYEMTLKATCQ
jgi:hypothetical protein